MGPALFGGPRSVRGPPRLGAYARLRSVGAMALEGSLRLVQDVTLGDSLEIRDRGTFPSFVGA
jgi:hypothetical protein